MAKDANENDGTQTSMVKLTKAEKRAKIKKIRKEAKKQAKEVQTEEVQNASQAEVLVCIPHRSCLIQMHTVLVSDASKNS